MFYNPTIFYKVGYINLEEKDSVRRKTLLLLKNYFFFYFFFLGSLWDFILLECKPCYSLENDEKEFSDKREKVYNFMKIPLEVERFMFYGICQVCKPHLDFTIVKHSV